MKKSVAVLAIHGIGSQGVPASKTSSELTFSKELARRVVKKIGKGKFKQHVAWREVFWADVLQSRQKRYLRKIKRQTSVGLLRRYLVHNLSDAAAYRKIPNDPNANTYERIHGRIDRVLDDFQRDPDVDGNARLIILAHSLGGHIMSNYLYDMQKNPPPNLTDFQQAKTTMAFVTFGCNIPLFTFAYSPPDVTPISRPGTALKVKYKLKTWWGNYYDKDDVLGFPLEGIGPKYKALVKNRELKEIQINAGNLFRSRTPWSHNDYWEDKDFYGPVARLIKKAI